MEPDMIRVHPGEGIPEVSPLPERQAGPGKAEGAGTFEALLSRVAHEMERLKGKTGVPAGTMAAEGIKRPEELEAALLEAARKFRHCMVLKENLIKAYHAAQEA